MWGKDLIENCQKMLKKAIFVEVSSNSGKESGINNQQQSLFKKVFQENIILTFVEILQFYVYLNQIWEDLDCGQEQPRNAKNVIFDKVFKIF